MLIIGARISINLYKALFSMCEKSLSVSSFFCQTKSLFKESLFFSACQWNKRSCKLCLHYEDGFALYAQGENGEGPARLLWQESFEKLSSSSDDNHRLLTLDFHGEEGLVVN